MKITPKIKEDIWTEFHSFDDGVIRRYGYNYSDHTFSLEVSRAGYLEWENIIFRCTGVKNLRIHEEQGNQQILSSGLQLIVHMPKSFVSFP